MGLGWSTKSSKVCECPHSLLGPSITEHSGKVRGDERNLVYWKENLETLARSCLPSWICSSLGKSFSTSLVKQETGWKVKKGMLMLWTIDIHLEGGWYLWLTHEIDGFVKDKGTMILDYWHIWPLVPTEHHSLLWLWVISPWGSSMKITLNKDDKD